MRQLRKRILDGNLQAISIDFKSRNKIKKGHITTKFRYLKTDT